MPPKSSAHYQRKYRDRLREQGLVKKEVWILPEHGARLSQMEKVLRSADPARISVSALTPQLEEIQGRATMSEQNKVWTTSALNDALANTGMARTGKAKLELIDGVDQAVYITMTDFGDLPIFLTVSGEQIIVESVLWSVTEVVDVDAFNEAVLRTHKYFPLSTVSLDRSADHGDHYYMFGALSASSKLENVVLELEVLASNVLQATQAYAEFLKMSEVAS